MKTNSIQAPSTLIPEYIGSDFDAVLEVARNIEAVKVVAENIENFKVLPASETTAGIAEIATQTEVNQKTNDNHIVTPKKLGVYAAPLVHTHTTATPTESGFLAATDKQKLDGIDINANNYTHPISDGSLHVPATGTANNGKVLMAGATAGSISWQTIQSVVTDHTLLTNIGTNTHAQIDTALTRLVNTSGTNTGDQTITLTGDVIGSGTGSFSTTLKNTGTAGTYKSVTTDSQGRVISGTNPTTIAGFGITDVYTKTEVDIIVGDINAVLDTINGEVI